MPRGYNDVVLPKVCAMYADCCRESLESYTSNTAEEGATLAIYVMLRPWRQFRHYSMVSEPHRAESRAASNALGQSACTPDLE